MDKVIDIDWFSPDNPETRLLNPISENVHTAEPVKAVPYIQPAYEYETGYFLVGNSVENNMGALKLRSNKVPKYKGISNGLIQSSRCIRYYSGNEIKCTYFVKTLGIDGISREIILSDDELYGKKVQNILSEKGRIRFVAGIKEDEINALLWKHIVSAAEKSDFIYPEFTCWKNGVYYAAENNYRISTPFFMNILPNVNVCRYKVAKKTLDSLKVFKKNKHRLTFLLILHYQVIRKLIKKEYRMEKSFYIHIFDTDIALNMLTIFQRYDRDFISAMSKQRELENYIHSCYGATAFVKVQNVKTRYNIDKTEKSLEYIKGESKKLCVVILENEYTDLFFYDFFNVFVKKSDIDYRNFCLSENEFIAGHLRHFAKWISEKALETDLNDNVSKNIDISKEYACLYGVFDLVKRYYEEFDINLNFYEHLLEPVCEESQQDVMGDWIVEKFAETYIELCSKGKLKKFTYKKGGENPDFRNFKSPFVIEFKDLICIKEEYLKLFLKGCNGNMSVHMLKKSLYDAGALDCGKNKSFRKNINIGQSSPLSVIAIHKNYLTGIGEMNI